MSTQRFETMPCEALAPYVQAYWGFVRTQVPAAHFTVTPDRFLEVLVCLDPPRVVATSERLAPCSLIPLLNAPLVLDTSDTLRCAAVRLHAWSAGLIFPQTRAAGAWHDVSTMFAGALPAIAVALSHDAWPEVTAAFEAVLLRAFASAQPSAAALATVRSLLAQPSDDRPSIDDLAAKQQRSRRGVERDVRALTRRSPKALANLARFEYVRDMLWLEPERALETLALEAGYADQAHLTREFRRYAARSPREFSRECLQLKAASEAVDVANLQDRAPRNT